MKEIVPEHMGEALRLHREAQESRGPAAIKTTHRCACGHLKPLVSFRRIVDTGLAKDVTSNVCDCCLSEARRLAWLVCVGCREVVCQIKPHKDNTGFAYLPGRFYHVMECPVCGGPEVKKSDVVEKILFYKASRLS